jgi:phytoene synthase
LAYCQETASIGLQISEPMVARTKLAWWHDETLRLFQQQAQHPITRALAEILPETHWPQSEFEHYLFALEMDQDTIGFPTWKECELYCARFSGAPAVLMSYVLGFTDPKTLDCVREIGLGLRLTSLIQNFGQHCREGRIYLPQQTLEAAGLNPHALRHLQASAELTTVLKEVTTRAREHLMSGFSQMPATDRKTQLPHLIQANIAVALLKEIENSDYDVLNARIDLTVLRKFWIAVSTKKRPSP